MPPRKIPPAPRTRCNAPGAKAGCVFFAPGFFAQAKKGGSRRHGAKAFDLCVAARQEEEQEQLAALAPSSALRTPSPASGRRAGSRLLAVLRLEIEDQVALEQIGRAHV